MEGWEGEGRARGKINGQRWRAHFEWGAGFAVGRLGGKFTPLRGLALESSERMSGTSALTVEARIRHGVRRDNWSEGRFWCRWPKEFKASVFQKTEAGGTPGCGYHPHHGSHDSVRRVFPSNLTDGYGQRVHGGDARGPGSRLPLRFTKRLSLFIEMKFLPNLWPLGT